MLPYLKLPMPQSGRIRPPGIRTSISFPSRLKRKPLYENAATSYILDESHSVKRYGQKKFAKNQAFPP